MCWLQVDHSFGRNPNRTNHWSFKWHSLWPTESSTSFSYIRKMGLLRLCLTWSATNPTRTPRCMWRLSPLLTVGSSISGHFSITTIILIEIDITHSDQEGVNTKNELFGPNFKAKNCGIWSWEVLGDNKTKLSLSVLVARNGRTRVTSWDCPRPVLTQDQTTGGQGRKTIGWCLNWWNYSLMLQLVIKVWFFCKIMMSEFYEVKNVVWTSLASCCHRIHCICNSQVHRQQQPANGFVGRWGFTGGQWGVDSSDPLWPSLGRCPFWGALIMLWFPVKWVGEPD